MSRRRQGRDLFRCMPRSAAALDADPQDTQMSRRASSMPNPPWQDPPPSSAAGETRQGYCACRHGFIVGNRCASTARSTCGASTLADLQDWRDWRGPIPTLFGRAHPRAAGVWSGSRGTDKNIPTSTCGITAMVVGPLTGSAKEAHDWAELLASPNRMLSCDGFT